MRLSARHAVLLPILALAGACAKRPPDVAGDEPLSAGEMRILERLAGQQIVVFPVQYLTFTDQLGWQQSIAKRADYLAALDDEIAFAMSERGLGRAWVFGSQLERASRMNSTFVTSARALAAESLRGRVYAEQSVRDPLASQIRALVGLKGQRYALLPVELRMESTNGIGVGVLKVLLIDSRLAKIRWVGEVRSDAMRTFSPALATSIAKHFADLVVPQ